MEDVTQLRNLKRHAEAKSSSVPHHHASHFFLKKEKNGML
jgi:hypothetical protein